MNNSLAIVTLIVLFAGIVIYFRSAGKKKKLLEDKLKAVFPEAWHNVLENKVVFYSKLEAGDRALFEKRIQRFLAEKNIEGIDTEIDDTIKILVAASAVIPTFAFPKYNYPNVHTILIYPNSFDREFQTKRYSGHEEFITGMVGNRSLNGTVLLSKPDLVSGFDGLPNDENVGIHEFVHLLDKEDGETDGIPEVLIEQPFVGPWLHEIKHEIKRIEAGNSDINKYALTNNAEFLAVVSEYFFDNPAKFQKKHAALYELLSSIFNGNKPGKFKSGL